MAPTQCRQVVRVPSRQSSAARKLLLLAGTAVVMAFATLRALVHPEFPAFTLAGRNAVTLQAVPPEGARAAGVTQHATEVVKYKFKGCARYNSFYNTVYKRKRIPQMRIRLDLWGQKHKPFYHIKVFDYQPSPQRSGKFIEKLGYWDPLLESTHKHFFKLKCDRVMHWLRRGAMPTPQVATLLDRAGLIRRTGPISRKGEWEYRVPPDSGPNPPEGWNYTMGIHEVTWNNKPQVQKKVRKAGGRNRPLIEKYSFKGYMRIPLDYAPANDPLLPSTLMDSFNNTNMPVV